ncbi:SUKH-3 domain-containing protein [Lysinibacillus xylanilyticus]|uniref:SUKH-3 domain-containing protein n=1 Tax=Lysinibacillus xylanilyticus TaxID=582475 RepID=UPI003830857B
MEGKVKDLLFKSGWYKEREADINEYLNFLINEEYAIFKSASDFFKEYGGLIIQFENPKRLNSYLTLSLNPIDAGNSIFREVSKRYEDYCNELFVVIGEIALMGMTWYISSGGAFYGGNDDSLIRLGDDFYQAFHNIISGVELEIITIEDE